MEKRVSTLHKRNGRKIEETKEQGHYSHLISFPITLRHDLVQAPTTSQLIVNHYNWQHLTPAQTKINQNHPEFQN